MFTKTFTDPQGQTHTNAVFMAAYANYTSNKSENHNFNIETGLAETNTDNNAHLQYRMYYWTNQAAKDAGNLPYVLANTNVGQIGEVHYLNQFSAEYDGLTAEQKAEKHCQDVVLAV